MKLNKLMLTMLFVLGVFVLTQCKRNDDTPDANEIDCSQTPDSPECTEKPASCGEGKDCVRAIYSSNTDAEGNPKLLGYLADLTVSWGVTAYAMPLPEGQESVAGEDARMVEAQKEYLSVGIYDVDYPNWAYHVEVAPMPGAEDIGRIRPPFPATNSDTGAAYMLAMNNNLEKTPYNFVDPRIIKDSDIPTCYPKETPLFDLSENTLEAYIAYKRTGSSDNVFVGNLFNPVIEDHVLARGKEKEEGTFFKMAFNSTNTSAEECTQLAEKLREGMEDATFHTNNLKFPLTVKWVDRANNNAPVEGDKPGLVINMSHTVEDLDNLKYRLGLNEVRK